MKLLLLFVALIISGVGYAYLSFMHDSHEVPSQISASILSNDPFTIPGPKAPDEVNVIIEIEKGTKSRYVYDSVSKSISLSETSFYPLLIPGDYGSIPATFGRDGNLLGVIVLSTDPAPPGTLITVRPISVLVIEEQSVSRSIIIGVPIADIRYRDVYEISDLETDQKNELIEYMEHPKTLQGRPAKLLGYEKSDAAKRVVELCIEAWKLVY